jgi:acyl-CoA dehydrogenase
MFEDVVDRLLRDGVTPELILSCERGDPASALWTVVEDNGLTIAAAPEALGGVGADWSDCFPIIAAAGRHAAPIPLVETLSVNLLLGQSGCDVVTGAASLGLNAEGQIVDGGFSGTVSGVPWGRNVEHILFTVSGQTILVGTKGARVGEAANVAGEPRDTFDFNGAQVVQFLPVSHHSDPVLITGAAVRAAQISGALTKLRDMAVEYAGVRVQFGRPLAKFQAVQHQIAVLAEQAALARSAAEAAFHYASGPDGDFYAAVAKQVTSEAAGEGAAIAHAVFGAIGFTQEYVLHLFTRRLWSWRSEFGNARYWADAIGSGVCTQGADAFWPNLVAGTTPIFAKRV